MVVEGSVEVFPQAIRPNEVAMERHKARIRHTFMMTLPKLHCYPGSDLRCWRRVLLKSKGKIMPLVQ